jgi:hypothetical protein
MTAYVQTLQERSISTSAASNHTIVGRLSGSTRSVPAESVFPQQPVPKQGPQQNASAGRREPEPTAAAAKLAVDTSRSNQTPILRPQAAPRHQALATSALLETAQPWPQGHRSETAVGEGCWGAQERAGELASYGYICYGGDGVESPSLKDSGAGASGSGVGGGRGVHGGVGAGGGGGDTGGQRPRSHSQARVLSC